MLYNTVLVSATRQHESAIGMHSFRPTGTSLPAPTPSHPSGLSQSTRFPLPPPFLLTSCLISQVVTYTFPHDSQFAPHPPPPAVSTSLSFMSASPLLLRTGSSGKTRREKKKTKGLAPRSLAQMEKNPPTMRFDPWVGKIPWRRKWQPTPVFLPGESQGQRSRASYCPWGHKESDTTV